MKIPGIGKAKRLAGRAANRLAPGALVLLYHRVTELASDPQWLAAPQDVFDEQLDFLKRNYVVLSLREMLTRLREGALPQRSVAITFDDGYADNLYEARPLLEKHGLPATVFVASGFVGGNEEFFWDELDRLLLQPGKLPAELGAPPPEETVAMASPMTCDLGAVEAWRWAFGADADYPAERAQAHAGWNVLCAETPTARHMAYRALCPAIADAAPALRREWLDQIRRQLQAPRAGRWSHRVVTAEELNKLGAGGLVEVGAHTVHHARLAGLSSDEQRREIAGSKSALEEMLGRPVTTFSYPFGNHGDFTDESVAIARETGFEAACANHGGSVRHGADPMRINRVIVRNWPAEELERRIRGWFDE